MGMKVIGVNGSPRKTWNTATLLQKALEGAASKGAETELIHLYDLDFKGCRSCYACKIKGGKSFGKCAVQDGITQLLNDIENIDAIILGSPIYFGTVSGEMRSFMERLIYPYFAYTHPFGSMFPKRLETGFIYTLGLKEEMARERGCLQHVDDNESRLRAIFGNCESLCSFDSYQFEDYSKVVAPCFDPEEKARRRKEVFPQDCQKAFEMGARLVQK